jgi:hypothetical protein
MTRDSTLRYVARVQGLSEASWSDIEALRAQIVAGKPESIQQAAEQLTALLVTRFSTIILARVFLVLPLDQLPADDSAFARAIVDDDPRLTATTPVLTLLGTHGRRPEWNDRTRSERHLAIPLLDRESVLAAPMIARLLADLEVDLQGLGTGGPIATRMMVGGRNAMFYVPEARTARDELGRPIIQPKFAAAHGVESVFGMGGAYLDGTLALAIVFCAERVDRVVADRYGSLINSFKMATLEPKNAGRIWRS